MYNFTLIKKSFENGKRKSIYRKKQQVRMYFSRSTNTFLVLSLKVSLDRKFSTCIYSLRSIGFARIINAKYFRRLTSETSFFVMSMMISEKNF